MNHLLKKVLAIGFFLLSVSVFAQENNPVASPEAAGAVFLPAAGWRNGNVAESVSDWGYYWSSTGGSYSVFDGSAYSFKFYLDSENKGAIRFYSERARNYGYSVRLVINVN